MSWSKTQGVRPHSYDCGYCGRYVASKEGYNRDRSDDEILICPNCERPTYLEYGSGFTPRAKQGDQVAHLPAEVGSLYEEARSATAAGAWTSAVMACRKILMNVAVENGAAENQSFVKYVDWLNANGYIPPNGKGWVDHIRSKGNEANHEIKVMTEADAESVLVFTSMLLKFVYELPAMAPPRPS